MHALVSYIRNLKVTCGNALAANILLGDYILFMLLDELDSDSLQTTLQREIVYSTRLNLAMCMCHNWTTRVDQQ